MKRLLQLGTILLVLAAFVTPILEFFDQWDPAGPDNDVEMAVFGLIFVLCLVLLLCELLSKLATVVTLQVSGLPEANDMSIRRAFLVSRELVLSPVSPPLRT